MIAITNYKKMAMTAVMLLFTAVVWANGTKLVYATDIYRTIDQYGPTTVKAKGTVMASKLNIATDLASALSEKKVQFCSVHPTTGKYNTGNYISPYGHYFTVAGVAVSNPNTRAIMSKYDGNEFSINAYANKVEEGTTYTFAQALVNTSTNDTILFKFSLTIGNDQSMTTEIPAFNHRADLMDSWLALPYVQLNDEEGEYVNCIQGNAGDKITIGMRPRYEGESCRYSIKNSAGSIVKAMNTNDYVINDASLTNAGVYNISVIYTFADGTRKNHTAKIFVDVQEHQGEYFDWTTEAPRWSYDFRDEYPNGFPAPTKVHNFNKKNGGKANCVEGEWWSVFWGDNLNADCGTGDVLQKEMQNMMAKYDRDFAYIRDEMGWPPDINARMGWKSFVYVFGSGLNNDNTPNTEAGGYQSSTYTDGRSWPCVWASYYPVSRFRDDADRLWNDGDYQREAMIHEGIHAIFADLEGVKKSSWFHEAGNVWLQMAMNAKRDGTYGAPGWLGVGNLICPFMPIECYSGWLQDGSFGGPAAEGVNMYNGSQQICTWRNLIGGVQYGEIFPIFMGEAVGQGAVPWIWRYCRDYVLKGIAQGNAAEGVSGIGDAAMRKFIMQYRAKLATLDFGGFSEGCRSLLNGSFGTIVKAEFEPYWIDVAPFSLTPYQTLVENDADGLRGWLAPDTITNPGWSGGNIIPIHVTGNGCEISFRPEDDHMMCQLCYRTKDGRTFYSQIVACGKMVLNWTDDNRPANDVVFVVPCNTDYIYEGDAQRKKHWDYRIKLGEGALAPASIRVKWYFYEQTLKDNDFETGIENVKVADSDSKTEPNIRIVSGAFKAGHQVRFDLDGINPKDVVAHLVGVSGVMIDEQNMSDEGTIQLPASLNKGMYILALRHNGKVESFKVYVE